MGRTVDVGGHPIEAAEIVEAVEIGIDECAQKQACLGQTIGGHQLGKPSNPLGDGGRDHESETSAEIGGFKLGLIFQVSAEPQPVQGLGSTLPVRLHFYPQVEMEPGAQAWLSSSARASLPASPSISPPLPITIPFCESRSTSKIGRHADDFALVLHRGQPDVQRMRKLVPEPTEELLPDDLGDEGFLRLVGGHVRRKQGGAFREAGAQLRNQRLRPFALAMR